LASVREIPAREIASKPLKLMPRVDSDKPRSWAKKQHRIAILRKIVGFDSEMLALTPLSSLATLNSECYIPDWKWAATQSRTASNY
jgi:hypothetical protein